MGDLTLAAAPDFAGSSVDSSERSSVDSGATMVPVRRVVMKLRDECQMNCLYCANDDGAHKNSEMSHDVMDGVFNHFDFKEIELTGGEPTGNMPLLLRAVVAAKAREASMIMVNSNLELLNETSVGDLERAGLTHMHFALNTMDQDRHRSLRGTSSADLGKVFDVTDYVLEQTKLVIVPEFVLMNENMEELQRIYTYFNALRQGFGNRVSSLELQKLIPSGRAKPSLSPPRDQILSLMEGIRLDTLPIRAFCFGGDSLGLEARGFEMKKCTADVNEVYVAPQGQVYVDNFSGKRIADSYKSVDKAMLRSSGFKCQYA